MKGKYKLVLLITLILSMSSCDSLLQILNQEVGGTGQGITEAEAISGLKAALEKGVQYGSGKLGQTDGFLKNEAFKILIPEEAKKAEQTIRDLGLGSLADNAITAMNRGAENASKQATDIFVSAIRNMTIAEAFELVTGGEGAATDYLFRTTSHELRNLFKPIVQSALDQAGATKYWTEFATRYNSIPLIQNKVQVDLNAYVTEKALSALFSTIREEENKIRANPAARTTEILRKVFGYADAH